MHLSLDESWWVSWLDESESEVIGLSAPVKLRLEAHMSSEQTHTIMAGHASNIPLDTTGSSHLKSWNNLALHLFCVFTEKQSLAVYFLLH